MERIVLSNKYVDEIRTAPETQLSVRKGMVEVRQHRTVYACNLTYHSAIWENIRLWM